MPPMEEEASPMPLPKKRERPRKDKSKEERDKEETPAEKMREKKQPHHPSTVDEKYIQWKSLVPVLYDCLANPNLLWPSLSLAGKKPRAVGVIFKDEQGNQH